MSADITLSLAVGGATKSLTDTIATGETISATVILETGAADVEVALGGISNPKMIAVFGGVGVSARLVSATGQVFPADPVAILSAKTAGIVQASVFLSNSGTQPVTVTVMAAQ
jgi:hypothetical protein